jgi:hypothetical protein
MLLEAYMSVKKPITEQVVVEREDDDMEAVSKYSNVRVINLYIMPPDGAIEQLYSASVNPEEIAITNGTTTLIGFDEEQKVDLQVIIQPDGVTSIVPTGKDGDQADGPWPMEPNPIFWDTGDETELNLMIKQEV